MSRGTLDSGSQLLSSVTRLSLSLARIPIRFTSDNCTIFRSEPRSARTPVWALSISLAATFEITCCFLFLRLLRCFSSPGSLHTAMYLPYDDGGFLRRVSPFRYLRIEAYLQLPAAFRSLSRPSSAPDAKAFTLCSSSLELSLKYTLMYLCLFSHIY